MWAQFIAMVIGIWLMAAPAVLKYAGAAADNSHTTGPLVATLAAVALWECTRGVRFANVPLGLWLVIAPMVLEHETPAAVNSVACGLALASLAFVRGRVKRSFGGGWAALLHHKAGKTA
ncbi:MAG: SPW repeat protein [Candidatus Hydrogenedentes bacterium]|nr:SPW repeat protein [Candidatus Hydrogenedentota bacterium]